MSLHQRLINGCRAVGERGGVKFLGFVVMLLLIGVCYELIPEYHRAFYKPVWKVCQLMLPLVLMIAWPYIAFVDRRMAVPEDGYWHFGLLVLGKWGAIDWSALRQHILGWAVKGFFLPLMLAGGAEHLHSIGRSGMDWTTFEHLYSTALNILLMADVAVGATGYLLTLRLFDAHIRSVDGTLLGWISALCCYPPFSTFFWSKNILGYHGETDWQGWLFHYPMLSISWGFAILLLLGIYVWATCSFGIRFSNLTNRGIISRGPYRYVKHPAYLAKNLAWWMMSVPFATHSTLHGAIRGTICLLLTNAIYWLRAWTEERHLKKDPEYQAYCTWMEQFGLWAEIRRWLRNKMRLFKEEQPC
jgi:protein-S-isoprenylcysteine O-methyltransferase Ste14